MKKNKEGIYYYISKGNTYELEKSDTCTEKQYLKEMKSKSPKRASSPKKAKSKSPKKSKSISKKSCDTKLCIPKKDVPKMYVCDEKKFRLVKMNKDSVLYYKKGGDSFEVGSKRTFYFKKNPNKK